MVDFILVPENVFSFILKINETVKLVVNLEK